MFARSLQKRVLGKKFQIHWFDGLPFRISTNYMMGSFTNIGYLWERINKGGKSGYFWSWSLRGCSEPASQARGLAWILEPGVNLCVSVRCMSWHRLTSQCPQTAETIGKSSSPRSPEKATPKKSLLVWWRPSWLQNMLMMIVLLAIKDPSLKSKTWHYGMPLQNVQDIKFEQ